MIYTNNITIVCKSGKAFLDVGEDEAMTRKRWGASKFVKHQLRARCHARHQCRLVKGRHSRDDHAPPVHRGIETFRWHFAHL